MVLFRFAESFAFRMKLALPKLEILALRPSATPSFIEYRSPVAFSLRSNMSDSVNLSLCKLGSFWTTYGLPKECYMVHIHAMSCTILQVQ